MIQLEAELDASEAEIRFGIVAGRFDDFRPVLAGAVLSTLRTMERTQFDSRGSLGTPVWPMTLAASTIREKHRLGFGNKPMMRRTDRLYLSLTKRHADAVVEPTEDSLTFGTRVPYARFHQTGGPRLPQRQVIPDPVPEATLAEIRESLRDYLLEGRIR